MAPDEQTELREILDEHEARQVVQYDSAMHGRNRALVAYYLGIMAVLTALAILGWVLSDALEANRDETIVNRGNGDRTRAVTCATLRQIDPAAFAIYCRPSDLTIPPERP